MDGRCATCRWWEELDANIGECERYKQAGSLVSIEGVIGEPDPDGDWRPANNIPELCPEFSGYRMGYGLFTTPEFGCVQWEAKEPTP